VHTECQASPGIPCRDGCPRLGSTIRILVTVSTTRPNDADTDGAAGDRLLQTVLPKGR